MLRLLLVVSTTPPEIPLASFYGADDLKGRVVDLTNQMTWNNKHEVVKKCAELAYANGYQRFALGKNGLCLSGANMKDKYYLNGIENAACIDRIGAGNSILYILLVSSCTCPFQAYSITKCFANHDRHSIYRKEIEPQTRQIHILTTSQDK